MSADRTEAFALVLSAFQNRLELELQPMKTCSVCSPDCDMVLFGVCFVPNRSKEERSPRKPW